tara:strand:- start:1597 stop:2823 length:1227 start_codon:yes stop_codon:yes gene_type:complete
MTTMRRTFNTTNVFSLVAWFFVFFFSLFLSVDDKSSGAFVSAFSSKPVAKPTDVFFASSSVASKKKADAASNSNSSSGKKKSNNDVVVVEMGTKEDYEREHQSSFSSVSSSSASSSRERTSESAPSGKNHPRRVGPKLEDGEDEKDETNVVELTRASLLKTPTEFKREMKREKSEKERRKEEAALAWFENTHPSSQYKMDEFEKRQKEKEEFDAKMREEREKEEKRLTKKIEWFDDPVKEDDDDLWIADRRWQYDKNDPLMDFEDYEHDQTEEEKKIDYGELLLKRIKKKVTSMKTVEDLITYQKDLMSSYGILNAEKAVEKQKEAENDQAAELAKKEIEENPAKATKSAAFALDAELFEKALQRKTEREAEARVQKKTKNRNLDYNRKLFEKAMAAKKAREEQQKRR